MLNSLGEPADRARYVDALRRHFEADRDALSEESRETLVRNPLRVLDSKRRQDAALIAAAPSFADFWSDAAATHFEAVRAGLDALGIPYVVEPRLVRGLDYYLRTTFEYAGGTLEGAQNALGGGGRYDGLVEALGGPPTPGIGFAIGLDRTLIACDDEGVFPAVDRSIDVFVVDTTGGREALAVTELLRRAGRSADRAFERPQHEGADEGRRPQRGGAGGHHRPRRARRRHGRRPPATRRRTADRRRPRPTCSPTWRSCCNEDLDAHAPLR